MYKYITCVDLTILFLSCQNVTNASVADHLTETAFNTFKCTLTRLRELGLFSLEKDPGRPDIHLSVSKGELQETREQTL